MIRRLTIESAELLSRNLAERGVLITPKGGSTIETLVEASVTPSTKEGVKSAEESLMKGSRLKDIEGVQTHDKLVNEYADSVAKVIKGNLDISKNVVNPIIKDSFETINKQVASISGEVSEFLSIVPEFTKPIHFSESTFDMVERFKDVSYSPTQLTLELNVVKDKESLTKLLLTGAGSYDVLVKEFADSLPEGKLLSVFNSLFGPSIKSSIIGEGRSDMLSDVMTDIDSALITHLYVRSLLKNIPAGVNLSLTDYRFYMTNLLSKSGRYVLSFISKVEKHITRKNLVLSTPHVGNIGVIDSTVIVRGEVYKSFIKDGGSPEAILGAIVTNLEPNYNVLIDRKDQLEKAWYRKERNVTNSRRLSKNNATVKALTTTMYSLVDELVESDKVIVDASVLKLELNKVLKELPSNVTKDLYGNVRDVVCKVFFKHTMALEVLTTIDSISTTMPDLSIDECIELSVTDLVANWLCSEVISSKTVV